MACFLGAQRYSCSPPIRSAAELYMPQCLLSFDSRQTMNIETWVFGSVLTLQSGKESYVRAPEQTLGEMRSQRQPLKTSVS